MWNPETIALVQHAVRAANGDVGAALEGDGEAHAEVRASDAFEKYREYARAVNEDAARKATLRGLLHFGAGRRAGGPIPLEEVEPASEIVKRFCTGAMSLGSISREAHETLAIAMNRLGGRSNTGEGGEDPVALHARRQRRPAPLGDQAGRLGPLRRDDPLPRQRRRAADQDGPGRQARRGRPAARAQGRRVHRLDPPHHARASGLISPPPHHDIYSIEDLKQLIYDLRCSNPEAQVSVKLVSEVGVGTVAAGVVQGQRRPRADLRPRRRHRRLAAVLDPGGRRAVGDRAGRDPADAAAQRPALADRRADRRPAEDRPRRRDRRDARRRRDGLLDRAADRHRLHHDARLPPEHLPGRDRHAGPRAAQALQGHPRARRQLLLLRRRGGARDPRLARPALARRGDRPRRPARARGRDRALEGARRRPDRTCSPTSSCRPDAPRRRVAAAAEVLADALDWELVERAPAGDRAAASRSSIAASDPQPQPLRRRHPLEPHRPRATARRACPRTRSTSTSRARPARASAAGWRPG